ncbi:hypothetical protein HCN51_30780 [Nonomuraea sp. FMUSA5-5]|uniref:Uncharacterized protein n=1 Tax=Nonomuraea composti TaxID=2720023 RepID=A0ABX1BBP1_9ACTN|nr:hypothetical protein [Nonomuraea sp. FMUSA5-5]NJP93779.1 hypothetical protein [Nonomuraea sp. FMUSA5-5]
MIERADQLVLNYVSKAADAAHGVLRPDQRLDFAKRLRARIEVERRGSQSAREVAKVLARFGDPAALVEREVRRLAERGVPTGHDLARTGAPGASGVSGASGGSGTPGAPAGLVTAPDGSAGSSPGAGTGAEGPSGTREFPAIVDDRDGPPGVRAYRRIAQDRLDRRREGRRLPFAGLRRAAMSSANPMATGGRDARTIVKEHPRDVAAMVILVVAALLVPVDLPPLAIFEVPLVVWAVGAALVLLGDGWNARDKFLGIGAPLLGYSVGGVVIGGLRVGIEAGLQAFVQQFFDVSGTMFMIGTGVGVVWLAYRLLDVS